MINNMKVSLKAIISLMVLAATSQLQLAYADEQTKAKLQAVFPGTPITDANPLSDFSGVIEMIVGKQVFYTNETGTRLMIGHIFDPKTNTDLTQIRLDELNKIDWSILPLKDAITIKKGKGEREFAVFTDPECPYCKKLEQEIAKLDNVTIHVFAYPLPMHPMAKQLAEQIMCSKDKAKAWTDLMLINSKPASDANCVAAQAVTRNLALGEKLGISGTPAMIAYNGRIKPGYLPVLQLDAWLSENAQKPQTLKKPSVEKKP